MLFEDLKKNIEKIEHSFLPPKSETGEYSEQEYLNVDAYVSLVHSEIEFFLESRCKEVCGLSLKKFDENGLVNLVLLGLVCFSGKMFDAPPDKKNDSNLVEEKLYLNKKLHSAAGVYNYNVKNNNGIKEKDILGLLLPLGFPVDDIDDVFLTEMNDFGKMRGEIAHTSNVENMTNRLDPYSVKSRIERILGFIKNIDDTLKTKLCA